MSHFAVSRVAPAISFLLLFVVQVGLADPFQLAITAVNGGSSPTYGTAFSVTVESQDDLGAASNVLTDTEITLSLNTGSGTLGGIVTGTISNGTSSVNISGVTYSKAENSVILTASGGSLNPGNSSSFNVNPAGLTVSGVTADNKVYDATPTATLQLGSAALVGVIGGDTVTLDTGSASGSFADKTAGTGKTVTVSGLALSGADAGNYTLTQPTTTADITAAGLTVSGVTADNKEYDATVNATLQLGSAALVGVIGSDIVTLDTGSGSGSFADKTVGTGKTVTVSGLALIGADAGNYTLTQPTTTADITPAPLTVINLLADDREYDGGTNATINADAASLNGVFAGDAVTLNISGYTASFADKNVDVFKDVTISGLSLDGVNAGNYTLIQPVMATADITPKDLTVTGVEALSKAYDGDIAAELIFTNVILVGLISGDDVTLDTSGAIGEFISSTVEQNKLVFVSGLALEGVDKDNYNPSFDPTATADIYGFWRQSTYANYAVGDYPQAVCLADMRGVDKERDLCVANYSNNTVSVRLCLDNGLFSSTVYTYPVDKNPAAIAYGNLYGNKKYSDLVTANNGTNTVSVLVNMFMGVIVEPMRNFVVGSTPNPGPIDVGIIDVNSDTRQDLVVANYNESTVSVLTNMGGAEFSGLQNYPVGANPAALCIANLDGKTGAEIVTANRTAGTLTILKGLSNGVYTATETILLNAGGPSPQPVDVQSADLNKDGVPDLVVANYEFNTITVLLGTNDLGNWQVASRADYNVGSHPKSLLVRNINRDGIYDIACINSGDGTMHIFLGEGDGTFSLEAVYAVGGQPVAMWGSNFNGDNASDLAIVDAAGNQVLVFLFAGPLANDFTVKNILEDVPANITLQGTSASGWPLEFEVVDPPENGTLSGSGSTLLYTPDPDYYGGDTFTYQAIDTHTTLTSTVATATIKVLEVNDRPSFAIATNFISLMEDSVTTNVPNFALAMEPGADNEDNQTFRFVTTITNKPLFFIRPRISADGTLTFKPKRNAKGITTILAQVKDSGGTQHGGTNLSFPEAFTIEIVPHPLKPHKGYYYGLFQGTNNVITHHDSGFITLKVATYGAFSGKLTGESGRFSFAGQFDLSGHAQTYVYRNNTTLLLDLQLDLTNGTDQVTGTVTDADIISANFVGDRLIYNAITNPAPLAGLYTMVIEGATDAAVSPAGDSYATITIPTSGKLRAVGKLSDGTVFKQTVGISKDGRWPFYVSLLSGAGSVYSWLTFTNLPDNTIVGEVSWIRPLTANKYYPNGFTNLTAAIGSPYTPPGVGQQVLATTNNLFGWYGGNFSSAVVADSVLTSGNAVIVNGFTVLQLSGSTNGYMSGSFYHQELNATRSQYGVALQQQNVARGFFLGTDQSGSFLLSPND